MQEEQKDIILSAVSSDDESFVVYFQGGILREWMGTYAHRGEREREGGRHQLDQRQTADIWHKEVFCHTV